MNNLRRYYNQNRKTIWGIVIIIASAILLLQMINYFIGVNQKSESSSNITTNESTNAIVGVTSNTSAVSGDRISSEKLSTDANTIREFIELCNAGNIEQAYNMLTDECKEQMYSTVQGFQENYYEYIFGSGSKSYEIENWTDDTYLVEFNQDLLAVGGKQLLSPTSDYITVVQRGDEYKLNINNYIGRTEINTSTEQDAISVNINSKDTYMEYEIYNITVKNNTDKSIILDTKDSTKTTYIQDDNGTNYVAYLNEIADNDLYIQSKCEQNLSIKFSNTYSTSRTIESLVFSELVIDENSGQTISFSAEM